MRFEVPVWLREGLEASYLGHHGDGFRILIKRLHSGLSMNFKVVVDREFTELFPDALEPEWEETPLSDWQTSYYGVFFIDVSIDPKTHIILKHPAEYIGMDSASYESKPYTCLKLRIQGEIDCICTERKKLAFFGKSGKCSTCWGIFSSLRKCPECGGSGRCPRCSGKGRCHTEDNYWFETNTGIMLKSMRYIEDKMVNRVQLHHLKPNVLVSNY